MSASELTIGQAAAAAGLTRKAIRVYETKGLLAPPIEAQQAIGSTISAMSSC